MFFHPISSPFLNFVCLLSMYSLGLLEPSGSGCDTVVENTPPPSVFSFFMCILCKFLKTKEIKQKKNSKNLMIHSSIYL